MHPNRDRVETYGLQQRVIDRICTVFATYPIIKQVTLYGFRAKGTQHPSSDIDLTVVSQNMTETQMLTLETQLDDLLLPYTIDISRFETIQNPDLIEHINRVGKIFFKSDPT